MQNLQLIKIIAIVGVVLGIGFLVVKNIEIDKDRTTESSLASQNNPSVSPAILHVGSNAPDFSLTTLDKNTFRLTDMKGKTVIVFGVAGWCGECVPEGKALTQVKREYADKGVEIIGVAFTKGDNNEFLKQYKLLGNIDIPLALDTDNVAGKYNITKLETTFILNKEGKIVYKDEHFTSYEDYKKELGNIL